MPCRLCGSSDSHEEAPYAAVLKPDATGAYLFMTPWRHYDRAFGWLQLSPRPQRSVRWQPTRTSSSVHPIKPCLLHRTRSHRGVLKPSFHREKQAYKIPRPRGSQMDAATNETACITQHTL